MLLADRAEPDRKYSIRQMRLYVKDKLCIIPHKAQRISFVKIESDEIFIITS